MYCAVAAFAMGSQAPDHGCCNGVTQQTAMPVLLMCAFWSVSLLASPERPLLAALIASKNGRFVLTSPP